jgi:hypothetical protein
LNDGTFTWFFQLYRYEPWYLVNTLGVDATIATFPSPFSIA